MDGRLRTVARTVGLVAIGVALTALPSSADQTVAPTLVRPPSIVRLQAPWLSTLRTVAATGDGARLVAAVFELLADLRRAGIASGCCDPARDYFLVSFVGADATGTPALTTVIAHDPMPASAELPGVHGPGHPLYQLFSRRRPVGVPAGDLHDRPRGESGGEGGRRLRRACHRTPRPAAGAPHGGAGNRESGGCLRCGRHVQSSGAARNWPHRAAPDDRIRGIRWGTLPRGSPRSTAIGLCRSTHTSKPTLWHPHALR